MDRIPVYNIDRITNPNLRKCFEPCVVINPRYYYVSPPAPAYDKQGHNPYVSIDELPPISAEDIVGLYETFCSFEGSKLSGIYLYGHNLDMKQRLERAQHAQFVQDEPNRVRAIERQIELGDISAWTVEDFHQTSMLFDKFGIGFGAQKYFAYYGMSLFQWRGPLAGCVMMWHMLTMEDTDYWRNAVKNSPYEPSSFIDREYPPEYVERILRKIPILRGKITQKREAGS